MSIIGRIARIEADNGLYAMGKNDSKTTFTLQVIGEASDRVDLQPGDEVEIISLERFREAYYKEHGIKTDAR